ncbi:MAG: hypothetical protein OXF97_00425 [Nitrospira sp.]|nr:hypothetical protein [Nitrospira sp.]
MPIPFEKVRHSHFPPDGPLIEYIEEGWEIDLVNWYGRASRACDPPIFPKNALVDELKPRRALVDCQQRQLGRKIVLLYTKRFLFFQVKP